MTGIYERVHAALMVVLLGFVTALSTFTPGDAVAQETDAFGYTLVRSGAECGFSFVDIGPTGMNTGTFVVSGDDTVSGAVALSAPFNIYGTVYNSLAANTNGFLTTSLAGNSGIDRTNDCSLPATPSPPGATAGARLYALHDDLVADIYTQYFPVCPRASDLPPTTQDCTVFQWDNVSHFPVGGATWKFQALLYHQSNDIVFQIGPGNPEHGSESTTGIQDAAPPTTGLTDVCNAANSVPDNTASCYFFPGPRPSEACDGCSGE
ncbi:MAG: hypothetical protein GY725_04265 [bacterium]|nr:hypothetical protein [bacterium]